MEACIPTPTPPPRPPLPEWAADTSFPITRDVDPDASAFFPETPHLDSRALIAGREASMAWADAAAWDAWSEIDELTFTLAVFYKAYALVEAWTDETSSMVSFAYQLAGNLLFPHAAVPRKTPVYDFCGDALDACAVPIVDTELSSIVGDLPLGRYDPVLKNYPPGPSITGRVVYDEQVGNWVLKIVSRTGANGEELPLDDDDQETPVTVPTGRTPSAQPPASPSHHLYTTVILPPRSTAALARPHNAR
ncbi:uncharacterized protein LOC62_02G002276 [Vanrija pseudolonga]|uniref:Uncharacterized protein n=1 Tax=Vanrija pseudolonga TaxID=143232 RepID=A0AAF0Y3H2_9TREE|nr:hypothetical protein LOC62_02G002276 [Vanrija pseudolonga]